MIKAATFKLPAVPKQRIEDYGEDFKVEWQRRKEKARGSVINLFKNVRGDKPRRTPDNEDADLGPRPASRRARAPTKSSVPTLDISDDVLDRLMTEPSSKAKKPSDDFLDKQRRRAGLPGHSYSASTMLEGSGVQKKPLGAEEVIYMFAGAPYFDVDEESGRPQPRVTLGWGPSAPSSQHQADHLPFKHSSFYACTAEAADTDLSISRKRRRLPPRERPSMLARNGKDAGSVGYSHFLESHMQQQATGHFRVAIANQQHLVNDPSLLGLRDFDVENALDRLSELSKVYEALSTGKGEATDWNQQMIEEIGEDLFSTLLDDELGTTSFGTGSVLLRTQIVALQSVLSTEHLWYDFSLETWRAQFGRLLWDPSHIEMQNGDFLSERDVLVFQLALAAELAVRMELATRIAGSESDSKILAQGDFEFIMNTQTETLEWHITAFQKFIQCFDISATPRSRGPLRRLSSGPDTASPPSEGDQEPDLVLSLRQETRQWDGLQAFASAISWPDAVSPKRGSLPKFDSFLTPPVNDGERGSHTGSEYGTPLSTPRTSPSPIEQHTPAMVFARSEGELNLHPALKELTRAEGVLSWQAVSWLSGTILPGNSLSVCIMRALLETSPDTKRLLPGATDQGFVHKQQMYWSSSSVIGRVLAPQPGAYECMGWVSLPFVPRNHGEGWMQPHVVAAPSASIEPRLDLQDLIATSSDPLRGHEISGLRPDDLTTLIDGDPVEGNEAQLQGMALAASQIVQHTTDGFLLPKIINLSFRSPRNRGMQPLTLPLTHDVQFVSSFPCYPVRRPRRRGTAQGLSPAAHDSAAASTDGEGSPSISANRKDLPTPPVHPLHVSFTHTIIPAAALLSSEMPGVKDSDSLILMGGASSDQPSVYKIDDQEVVVLDCRGSAELEVLARAWCSKVGENAIVGKSGRTCLACCIREAIGLGIGVVLRIS